MKRGYEEDTNCLELSGSRLILSRCFDDNELMQIKTVLSEVDQYDELVIEQEITEDALITILQLVPDNTNLDTLSFESKDHISEGIAQAMITLFNRTRANKLDYSGCDLFDEDMAHLPDILNNTKIKYVSLYDNAITEEGVNKLISKLNANANLVSFDLSYNHIKNVGTVCKLLNKMPNLVEFGYYCNPFCDDAASKERLNEMLIEIPTLYLCPDIADITEINKRSKRLSDFIEKIAKDIRLEAPYNISLDTIRKQYDLNSNDLRALFSFEFKWYNNLKCSITFEQFHMRCIYLLNAKYLQIHIPEITIDDRIARIQAVEMTSKQSVGIV